MKQLILPFQQVQLFGGFAAEQTDLHSDPLRIGEDFRDPRQLFFSRPF